MAVAGRLVYRAPLQRRAARTQTTRSALFAWSVQLLLNVGWSAAFFGQRNPTAGLFVIVPLWAAIATTAATAARVSRLAALLLIPYLAWTSFAAALNFRVWQLNHNDR
jgi:tryptophan-rich sensory protein